MSGASCVCACPFLPRLGFEQVEPNRGLGTPDINLYIIFKFLSMQEPFPQPSVSFIDLWENKASINVSSKASANINSHYHLYICTELIYSSIELILLWLLSQSE